MTPRHFYHYYRPGKPGWSRRWQTAVTVVLEALVFVSLLLMVPLYILVLAPR